MQEELGAVRYEDDNIKTLDWKEHIRLRPGMYIGKLGDGSSPDDGIYVLLKEVIDNSIDEFVMGNGKQIEVKIEEGTVTVRDFGRETNTPTAIISHATGPYVSRPPSPLALIPPRLSNVANARPPLAAASASAIRHCGDGRGIATSRSATPTQMR